MKRILLLLICVSAFQSFSQKKEKSSSFDLPEGESYVKQLKSGNTFYMEITKKEGIKVLLLDTLRKKIRSTTLELKLIKEKIGYYISEGNYEINGDLAVFLQIAEDRVPQLIRIVLDGRTGKLKSEEKLAELEKVTMGAAYGAVFGGIDSPDIDVIKDPESDYYAVVRYNTLVKETKDRIEVIHYDPNHKVINSAFYTDPNNRFKYTKYLSAYVNAGNYVVLGTYAFNTDKSGGDEARFYVAQLSKGKTTFKQQELSYRDFYKDVECRFIYNKAKQMINMFLITNVGSSRKGRVLEYHFQNVNPTTLKVDNEYAPDFTKVNEYYTEKMKRKGDFAGILRKTQVDKNGNMILFFQQVTVVSGNNSSKTFYGDVALLTISPAGKTINSAVFPVSILGGLEVSYMDMVTTDNNTYILFNNLMDNMERDETKDAKTVKARGHAIPVKYTYTANGVNKEYLFKKPKEAKGNPYSDFSISDYNPITKKYAVIYFDPEKDKAVLMWVPLN